MGKVGALPHHGKLFTSKFFVLNDFVDSHSRRFYRIESAECDAVPLAEAFVKFGIQVIISQ